MSRWARLVCSRVTGCVNASGDCQGVLGTTSETIEASADPRPLLPGVVQAALDDPSVPFREDRLAGILVTAEDTGNATVLVVARTSHEEDSVYLDLPAGVVSLDHSGLIRHCNRLMGDMFDIDAQGCIGTEVSRILPQPVLYSWNSVIKSVMMGHQVKVEFLPVAGRKNSGMLVRGGSGIVGLFTDITEALETEKRLRAVQRMNQAIFSASEAGILMFDGKGRILLANRAMARITGQSNSLVGMHVSDVFPDECQKWVDRSSKKLLARPGKGATSGDMEWAGAAGEARTVRLSLQSIIDDSGVVTHIMGYVDDITEQIQGMKRLETLGRSLDYMARLTAALPGTARPDSGSAGLFREILEADALAVYINDPFTGLKLSDSDGEWPEGLPPDEFHELRLGLSPGGQRGCTVLAGEKLGVLSGRFARGLLYPLGVEENPMGFVAAVYARDQAAMHREVSVGEIAAAMLTSGLLLHREHSETEKLGYLLRGRDRFLEDLFLKLPIPAFLFNESGEIVFWNDDMTLLAGENVLSKSSHVQQRWLDKALSGLGNVNEVLRRFSRGESILEGRFQPSDTAGGDSRVIQVRRVRSIGRGTDESSFLAAVFPGEEVQPGSGASSNLLGILYDLYSGTDPGQILRKAAFGALALTGAEAVRLTVDRMGSAQAPAGGLSREPDWVAEVAHEGERLLFQFQGGGRTTHADVLGRAVLTITGRMQAFLSPQALERITSIPGGLLMITDTRGKVLFSNWPGVVTGEGGFISMEGLLGESPPPESVASLRTVGSCTWQHPREGLVRGIALSPDPNGRDLWFPDMEGFSPERKTAADRISQLILENLLAYARRAWASVGSMSEMLGGRDPLRSMANSMLLDHGSALEAIEVLKIVIGSSAARTVPVEIEECLKMVSGYLGSRGLRMPDMSMVEEPPRVMIDPEWTARVIARLFFMAADPRGTVRVTADDGLVTVEVPVPLEPGGLPELEEITSALAENPMDNRIESGILASLLAKHGCRLEQGPAGSLLLGLPVME